MDLYRVFFLTLLLCINRGEGEDDGFGEVEEVGLDDFPLDDAGGGATDRVDEGGGDEPLDDINDLEDINLSDLEQTEASRQELLRKVMSAAMAKPGARQRLAQVMPILRTMSATQRLALAGLVTSQLMAPPGASPPPITMNNTNANLTDDLMIPISMDIAAMFRGLGRDATAARSNLFRGDLYKRHPPYRRRPVQSLNRRNTEVAFEGEMRPPPLPGRLKPPKLRPLMGKLPPPPLSSNMVTDSEAGVDCEFFSHNLCLQVADYPMEAILKSIQNTPNKIAFEALRKDSKQDFSDIYVEKGPQIERRQGGLSFDPQEDKHMCSSKVEVARPKRARATSGQWKYVVNTGDYTQTLRLEMCLKPKQPCSFLTDMKSECVQVYNYHRLLTWDQKAGLTMDIFKVPTCCSCHVLGPSHPFLAGQPLMTQAVGESMRQPVEPVRHATPPPRITYTEPSENNFVAAAEDRPTVLRLPPKQIYTRRPLGGLHNIPKRESPGRLPPLRTLPPRHSQDSQEDRRYNPPQYENLLRRTISNNATDNDVRPKYHPVVPTLNQRHPELPVDSLLADNTFSFVTSEPDYLPSKSYQEHPPRYHSPPPTTYSTTPKRVIYQTTYPSTPRRPSYPTTAPPPSTTSRRVIYPTTPSSSTVGGSKRVNYSYHPIIDFFKTSVTAAENQQKIANAEWTPITDQPRLMPK